MANQPDPLDLRFAQERYEDSGGDPPTRSAFIPTGVLRYDLFLLMCREPDDAERLRISHLIDAIRDAETLMGEELGSEYLSDAQAVLACWRERSDPYSSDGLRLSLLETGFGMAAESVPLRDDPPGWRGTP